jgi:hypothetical protein
MAEWPPTVGGHFGASISAVGPTKTARKNGDKNA